LWSAAVGSTNSYFLGNRLWWAAALLIAPIVASVADNPLAGILTAAVLVLPAFLIFDTDRGWWPDEVKAVPEDKERSRSETRLLTIWALGGPALGLVIAWLMG
jgi:hypothetical protein